MPGFSTTRTLAFGDCDPSGIAYFPSYLDLMVGVMEAFFADIGHPWPRLVGEQRIGTPTVTLDLAFERPGFHGDVLTFHLDVTAVGRSSVDLAHRVERDCDVLWRAKQRIVATSLDTHRAIPWPDDLRDALVARLPSGA
jgi:4-hydroxybenzoyl-CoA thioesterase